MDLFIYLVHNVQIKYPTNYNVVIWIKHLNKVALSASLSKKVTRETGCCKNSSVIKIRLDDLEDQRRLPIQMVIMLFQVQLVLIQAIKV